MSVAVEREEKEVLHPLDGHRWWCPVVYRSHQQYQGHSTFSEVVTDVTGDVSTTIDEGPTSSRKQQQQQQQQHFSSTAGWFLLMNALGDERKQMLRENIQHIVVKSTPSVLSVKEEQRAFDSRNYNVCSSIPANPNVVDSNAIDTTLGSNLFSGLGRYYYGCLKEVKQLLQFPDSSSSSSLVNVVDNTEVFTSEDLKRPPFTVDVPDVEAPTTTTTTNTNTNIADATTTTITAAANNNNNTADAAAITTGFHIQIDKPIEFSFGMETDGDDEEPVFSDEEKDEAQPKVAPFSFVVDSVLSSLNPKSMTTMAEQNIINDNSIPIASSTDENDLEKSPDDNTIVVPGENRGKVIHPVTRSIRRNEHIDITPQKPIPKHLQILQPHYFEFSFQPTTLSSTNNSNETNLVSSSYKSLSDDSSRQPGIIVNSPLQQQQQQRQQQSIRVEDVESSTAFIIQRTMNYGTTSSLLHDSNVDELHFQMPHSLLDDSDDGLHEMHQTSKRIKFN